MSKAKGYRKVDTTKPPTRWDIAYAAAHTPEGDLLVGPALNIEPEKPWPTPPHGYSYLIKSIAFSGTED